MNDQQYETAERMRFFRESMAYEHAPLADRKEAQATVLDRMKSPELITERLGWLVDGCHGHGAKLAADDILAQKRGNKPAALMQLLALAEWGCPATHTRKAWHTLTANEQANLTHAISLFISEQGKKED